MTREGVLAALRSAGHASLAAAEAVVLETDGSVSVITSNPENAEPSALRELRGFSGGG